MACGMGTSRTADASAVLDHTTLDLSREQSCSQCYGESFAPPSLTGPVQCGDFSGYGAYQRGQLISQ